MASRSSAGIGTLVTIVLLSVTSVALFVATIVFLARTQRLESELLEERNVTQEIIRPGERDVLSGALARARSERKSLVAYLNDSLSLTMRRVTGSERESAAELAARLDEIEEARTTPLIGVLRERDRALERTRRELTEARAAATTARNDLQAEAARVNTLIADQQATMAAMNAEISRYKAEVEQYRVSVGDTIDTNNRRVDEIRRVLTDEKASLEDRLTRVEQENLILTGQLDSLRRERAADMLRPDDEFALVDGRVVSVNAAENSVFIDLSRGDRLVQGMTFEVYDSASAIRPDADGNYPRGKATIEIIRIGDTASVARIVREIRGNPIVAGDVFANAVYDPRKTYRFVVAGDFDLDGDGIAGAHEREEIRAIIRNWGGVITDELGGDTDFLVLGARPLLPPQPPFDAPVPVINEYIRLQRAALEYDRLFDIATQTGIPVLNQNRLFTLTGMHATR
ncbi:MAG: hypothetical protein EA379_04225 [Phycisphaerales bacterium]|nr:MAG: hypothetical protein EA379_04225 [Phycisphaerales bacterium]